MPPAGRRSAEAPGVEEVLDPLPDGPDRGAPRARPGRIGRKRPGAEPGMEPAGHGAPPGETHGARPGETDGAPPGETTVAPPGETDGSEPMSQAPGLSRRRFLALAAGGAALLAGGGVAGYEWPHANPVRAPSDDEVSGVRAFVTRPDLRPPTVSVTPLYHDLARGASEAAAGGRERFVMLTPRHTQAAPSQQGLMVIDRRGQLVWFKPLDGPVPFDLDVQSYRGEPVLAWWQGQLVAGHGDGVAKLARTDYSLLETVRAGRGLNCDLHELDLTTHGTALVTAYEEVTADLRAVKGPRRGKVWVGHAQEIDLATGKVLLDWNSAEHVAFDESYEPLPGGKGVWDWFHINSISELPDGDLLISARNTWAVYKVDRSTGDVVWRLNGKRSDFSVEPAAHFYWQHDARMPQPGVLTIFDDGSFPKEERQSRGLLLDVDTSAKTVTLRQAYEHPAGFLATNQGSVQLLADGRVFVGWGDQPYFTEFAADGTILLDGELPAPVRSYRAYLRDYVGKPSEPPAIVAAANAATGSLVYLSWNGATEIARWQVLAGPSPSRLVPVGSQARAGFETEVAVASSGPWFAAVALDAAGRELGRTRPVERVASPPG